MTTLIIATRNAHKVGEIAAILGTDFRCISLKEFSDAPPVVEDRPDFAGNASKKATELVRWLVSNPKVQTSNLNSPSFVLADDSGLEVDALGGAPGVHSARFAALDEMNAASAGNSPDAANNAKLLRLLSSAPESERVARFRCVLALAPLNLKSETGDVKLFDGACEGRIALSSSGNGSFGYDPLFIPAGHSMSFAELGEAEKNKLSHRAKAVEKLREWFGQCGSKT